MAMVLIKESVSKVFLAARAAAGFDFGARFRLTSRQCAKPSGAFSGGFGEHWQPFCASAFCKMDGKHSCTLPVMRWAVFVIGKSHHRGEITLSFL